MKSLWVGIATLGLFTPAMAQKVPTVADFDRIHLRQNWSTFIPVENRSDTVQKLQLFGDDLFVQNTSGTISKFDARNGGRIWSFTPSLKYRALLPIAVNEKLVFLMNSTNLYIISRDNGKKIFEVEVGSIPTAAPSCDQDHVFVPLLNGKVVSYRYTQLRNNVAYKNDKQEDYRGVQRSLSDTGHEDLATEGNRTPSVAVLPTLRSPFSLPGVDASLSLSIPHKVYPPYTMEGSYDSPSLVMVQNTQDLLRLSAIKDTLEPEKAWEMVPERRIELDPVVIEASETLIMAGKSKLVTMLSTQFGNIKKVISTNSDIVTGFGLHDYTFYTATSDTYVYAYDTKNGELLWRLPAGGEVSRTPLVTDDALFITGGSAGVRKLERKTGRVLWPAINNASYATKIPGERIINVNGKFLYTTDVKNNLHIIDRNRGTVLTSINLGSLNLSLINEQDDRIILAGSDGRLVCLQDRDYNSPVRIKKEAPKREADKIEPAPEKKPMAAPEGDGKELPKKEGISNDKTPDKKGVDTEKSPEPKKGVDPEKQPEPKKGMDLDKEPAAKKDPEKKK
jgi:hypothetical protein